MENELIKKGGLAKNASYQLSLLSSEEKNRALYNIADALCDNFEYILKANEIDIKNAREKGIKDALIDRLMLNKERIFDMAEGVKNIAALPDPIGEVIEEWETTDGLKISKKRVPIGVVAIIYEARPNVTSDACALALKTSNALILRGGSEAINSNLEIMSIIQKSAYSSGIPNGALNIIEDTSRETATGLMRLSGYVDLLIPRGSASLIRTVVDNATVPVIETGAGNCHTYIDKDADFDMATKIVINAKVSRPSVCNACEKLLVHKAIAEKFLPIVAEELEKHNVKIKGCEETKKILPKIEEAKDEDWAKEYNDYIIAIKVVDDVSEAISHINKFNTRHSEAIVTANNETAEIFLKSVDASSVYHNASTRFTDGGCFGFGAEIGISTQKIHARGPMGLREITSYKYEIRGSGEIR